MRVGQRRNSGAPVPGGCVVTEALRQPARRRRAFAGRAKRDGL